MAENPSSMGIKKNKTKVIKEIAKRNIRYLKKV
jgi:hypothetical protein